MAGISGNQAPIPLVTTVFSHPKIHCSVWLARILTFWVVDGAAHILNICRIMMAAMSTTVKPQWPFRANVGDKVSKIQGIFSLFY